MEKQNNTILPRSILKIILLGHLQCFIALIVENKKVILKLFPNGLHDFATKNLLVTSGIYFYCTRLSPSLQHFLGVQVSPIWKKLLKSVQLVLHQRTL